MQLTIPDLAIHRVLSCQVGGLGDVVTGLARSCLARGHQVSVIMPFYER